MDAKRRWVFKTPQNDIMMSIAIVQHMVSQGVKTVGFIGFADAYGEGWYQEFAKIAAIKGITIVANERYNRADTSVTGRVLQDRRGQARRRPRRRLGRPPCCRRRRSGARLHRQVLPDPRRREQRLPARRRQGRGRHLPARRRRARRRAAPADNRCASRRSTTSPKVRGGLRQGQRLDLYAHAWDAGVLMTAAIPVALKKAKPGTPAFRAALRDALPRR